MTPIIAAALCTTGSGPDDTQQVATLQHEAGRDRDVLAAAAHRAQIEAARPILLRRVGED